ncbi:hypothetical protein BMS3Abin09_00930 [bacterium BMS3Abin09]|nr:hypothetical protein BMS3Abin09_00930 [bacterium BMS3Abin09]GBE40904.1 hypothetical protein BMS3Bbin09_00791 [bacterium BMS3Bbin09]HDO67692.1 hypothetical protein [Nitrospirota bacterium]HEW81866.1 hypothetical protein [Nitrospirota bacterium]
MKAFLFKIYMLLFMVLVVFFIVVIWNVTFGHIVHEYYERQKVNDITALKGSNEQEVEKSTFEKVILESDERVKNYLGYKILEETRIKGHFHHIGFDIGPDKRSYCVKCHGDIPHDAVKEIRAFLNMHTFFVGCQTCHIKLEGKNKTGVFKWYNRMSGEIVDSPVKTARPGTYKAKIIPFERVNGQLQRIDNDERIAFALEYSKREKTLTEGQKSRAIKLIHKLVSKKPVQCEECHQKDNPLLPFEAIGYPKERVDSITSTEVVGMIKNYTKFYMPKMLTPEEAKKK